MERLQEVASANTETEEAQPVFTPSVDVQRNAEALIATPQNTTSGGRQYPTPDFVLANNKRLGKAMLAGTPPSPLTQEIIDSTTYRVS